MSEKRDWKEGSYIRGEIDYSEEEAKEEYYFAWFHTESNLKPSDREEREKIAAIHEQIRKGVIQPNGMPVGWEAPKKKETPYERQQRRKQEIKQERKKKKKMKGRQFSPKGKKRR